MEGSATRGKLPSIIVCLLLILTLFIGNYLFFKSPTEDASHNEEDVNGAANVVDSPIYRKTRASPEWTDPIKLNDLGTSCKEPRIAVNGNNLHAVWADADSGKIYYKKSTDNGWTWGNDVWLASGSNPRIEVSGNNVHLLWNSGYKRSTNNGDTWGTAINIFSGLYQTVCYDLALYNNNIYVAIVEREGSSWPYNHYIQIKKSTTNGDSWGSWITLDGPTWDEMMEIAITVKGSNIHVIYGLSPYDHDAFIRWFNHTYSQSGGTSWCTSYKINTGGMQKAGLSISYSGSSVSMVWIELADLQTIKKSWVGAWSSNNILGFGDGRFTATSENYIVWGSTWPGSTTNTIYSNLDGILNTIEGYDGYRAFFDVSKENEDVHFVYIDNYQVYYKHKGIWEPPSPPSNLLARFSTGNSSNLELIWNASLDDGRGNDDVEGYTVYKSTTGVNGTYEFAAWIPATDSPSYSWIDAGAGDEDWNDYFYVVRANDTSDNEEQNNNKVGKVVNYLSDEWNLISIPLIQENTSREKVLQTIEGNYTSVYSYHAGKSRPWIHWHRDKPNRLNDVIEINHEKGYYIDMINPDHLITAGRVPENIQIQLKAGWNLVGYPSLTVRTRDDALSSIAGMYNKVCFYNTTTQKEESIGPDDLMNSGYGYWIHATSDCVWEVVP